MTLKMTTAQVVETSVTVTNSSFQNYTHPDDHTTRTTIETVEQQFGLDYRPSTQPTARWLSPLLLLSRHHPEPTGLGTSVGQQSKLRRQICSDSFRLDSASSGSQHRAGAGWTLGHPS